MLPHRRDAAGDLARTWWCNVSEDQATQQAINTSRHARGYSWPPFEPGNEVALKHGAHSEKILRRTMGEIFAEVVEVVPWISKPEFTAAVQAWLRCEAKVRLLACWLHENGDIDLETNEPRPAVAEQARWERLAAERRRDLGLDPLSRIKLESDFAHARRESELAEQMLEGRRLREVAEARLAIGVHEGMPAVQGMPLPAEPDIHDHKHEEAESDAT